KCLRRIRAIHERGTTVLFVSHDPGLIQKFCTEALLLDAGQVIDRGRPDRVLDYYTALLAEKYREGGARTRIIRPAGEEDAKEHYSASVALVAGEPRHKTAIESPAPEHVPEFFPRGHRTGNFRAVITSVF